jgi:cytochrome bd-type quinol oxidase subunit 2
VQLISIAFGAGLTGVVVNLTAGGDVAAARQLFAVFAVLVAVGAIVAYRSTGR